MLGSLREPALLKPESMLPVWTLTKEKLKD